MPLLDHFHPPLSVQRHWEGFHSKWASSIVDQLNEQLPPRYFAEPHVRQGTEVEIDVAAFEEQRISSADAEHTATLVWSPALPTMTIPLDSAGFDVFEVQIINDEAGPRLVAAIELVSPANKDRPAHRPAFATKCAAYLQSGVCVMVVDIVTVRRADLHSELLDVFTTDAYESIQKTDIYAAAYRTRCDVADEFALDVWIEPLNVGDALPTLPLWLSPFGAVPVDLEQSYVLTCQTLRIGPGGH